MFHTKVSKESRETEIKIIVSLKKVTILQGKNDVFNKAVTICCNKCHTMLCAKREVEKLTLERGVESEFNNRF